MMSSMLRDVHSARRDFPRVEADVDRFATFGMHSRPPQNPSPGPLFILDAQKSR